MVKKQPVIKENEGEQSVRSVKMPQSVICPDEESECSDGSTCCQLNQENMPAALWLVPFAAKMGNTVVQVITSVIPLKELVSKVTMSWQCLRSNQPSKCKGMSEFLIMYCELIAINPTLITNDRFINT